jgi:hypothetical protein
MVKSPLGSLLVECGKDTLSFDQRAIGDFAERRVIHLHNARELLIAMK